MKTAVYYSNSDVRIEELPVPKISEEELLVKVKACGICGSDLMEWYRIQKAPLVLGHELSGEIVKVGKNVLNFSKGDRVSVTHHVPCNTCHFCLNDHHSVCETMRTTKFYPGGFSEFLRVPGINVNRGVFLIPETMSYREAVFIEPLGCVFRGQRLAGFKPGMSVHIIGSGVTGILFVKLLKALGAGNIIASDINQYKLEKAKSTGADYAIYPGNDVKDKVRSLNDGRGADLVVSTAGVNPAFKAAMDTVGRGGTILFFAPPKPDEMINVPLQRLWKDEVKIVTSYASPPGDSEKAIEMIRSKRVEVKDMITNTFTLGESAEAFRTASESKESLKVIIEPER